MRHNRQDTCSRPYVNYSFSFMVQIQLVLQHQKGGGVMPRSERHLGVDNNFMGHPFFGLMERGTYIDFPTYFYWIIVFFPFLVPVYFSHPAFFYRNIRWI